ncbi:MAG: hypothetical protein ACYC5H_06510 [Methylovirgula sp.]
MSKGRNRLIIVVAVISACIYGTADAQEAFHARINELDGKVYRTGRIGAMTINENTAQEFIDRFSGADRFAGEDVKPNAIAHSSGQAIQTRFLAEDVGPVSTSTTTSLAQDYIDRLSGGDVLPPEARRPQN